MLKFVKDGALDLLALTLPSSLLQSIRQASEDDLFAPNVTHRQQLPRMRTRNTQSHSAPLTASMSRAVAHRQQRVPHLTHDPSTRQEILPDAARPTIQLPYEIVALIFQYLPASDLFSIVAVNRLWRQIAFLEIKQIDLSECFPPDCLGLEDQFYSDFDFVYNLFSMFPLISSLVIKDRYMRDMDLRVVTAGILAGKMAFTVDTRPAVGSEAYFNAQQAIAHRRHRSHCKHPIENSGECIVSPSKGEPSSTTIPARPATIRKTIKEELREFSRSVGTYVLIPQTRNTLRKKILERLEHNLEQKEVQEYCWMLENGIDPAAFYSSSATAVVAASSFSPLTTTAPMSSDTKRYPLVPMTHYRFQDCCFANDWGAAMDVNKLPMIGLAAAISGQGLVVDLEGSYGAPSRSIKTMLGFCFGAHCVLSLDLNFRHTHMELEHVAELLSENPILYNIDIVDSPAYHELTRLPALRGLGEIMERMQEACLNLDEKGLEVSLQRAKTVLSQLESAVEREEAGQERRRSQATTLQAPSIADVEEATLIAPPTFMTRPPPDDPSRPVLSLSEQLPFEDGVPVAYKLRTAKVLLKGVIHHGVVGLVNTRGRNSGQSLLHTLAWRRSYSSFAALATSASENSPSSSPPPPSQKVLQEQHEAQSDAFSLYPSSLPASDITFMIPGASLLSASPSLSRPVSEIAIGERDNSTVAVSPKPASEESVSTSSPGLTSLISISALPAALTSALSFRRLSLPATLWIPKDSEDIGVGGGSLPTPDVEESHPQDPFQDQAVIKVVSSDVDTTVPESQDISSSPTLPSSNPPALMIPEQHPVAISIRMAKTLLALRANPNVYNNDGRSAVVCASYMGFQPMEALLIEQGGYSKELIRIRETM